MFEQAYFKDSKISNYRDYTQKRYEALCRDLISLGIQPTDSILDFGCATGALLSEFKKTGYSFITGTDVSFWAINYGRGRYCLSPLELQYLSYSLLETPHDWVFCLDVLEHIGCEELANILGIIRCKYMVVRIPVCKEEGEPFVLEVSRNDRTHVQCHSKFWWVMLLSRFARLQRLLKLDSIYDSEGVFAGVFEWLQP